MLQFTNSCKNALAETNSLLNEDSFSADSDVLSNITPKSILSVMPVLSSYLFVGIHTFVDIYSIFDLDSMHVLSIGIRRLLKACLVTVPREPERKTSVLRTKSGSCRPFELVKRSVLYCLKRFVTKVSFASPGLGLDFGSVHGTVVSRNNGLFCAQGLTEVLEANYINKIGKVSPFLRAIVDV